ncbi:hypothetical protein T492DRAFT_1020544 [Pavlovales sp. CCMP2436]|nr:hypothetical protein T492DRAFT_1020544 [Pavlovales sp. CCMP2436]
MALALTLTVTLALALALTLTLTLALALTLIPAPMQVRLSFDYYNPIFREFGRKNSISVSPSNSVRRALEEHILVGGADASALLAAPDDLPLPPPLYSLPLIAAAITDERRVIRAAFLAARQSDADKGDRQALKTVSLLEWLSLLRNSGLVQSSAASAAAVPVRAMLTAFLGAQQQTWLESRTAAEEDSVAQLDWPEFQEALCLLAALAPTDSAAASAAAAAADAQRKLHTGMPAADGEAGEWGGGGEGKGWEAGANGEALARTPASTLSDPAERERRPSSAGAALPSVDDLRRALREQGAEDAGRAVGMRLRELAALLSEHKEVGVRMLELRTRAAQAGATTRAAPSARRPASAAPRGPPARWPSSAVSRA